MLSRSLSVLLLSFFLVGITVEGHAQQDFEDFKQQYKQGYAQFVESFENGVAGSMQQYKQYRKAYKEAYQEFKDQMMEKWGSFKERTDRQWVEYKENGNMRISADMKEGTAKVEVIADSKEEAEKVEKQMPEKVEKAVKSKGTREGFETKKLPNKEVTQKPVLKDQLKKEEGQSTSEYAKEVAKKKTKTKKVKGEDGKTRYVVTVSFALANDHLQERARRVEDKVYKFAKQFNLDPALVFAIIHVESYYNPTAASHANAYGLMQIVPSTAGRDAYRRVFNEDGVPTKQFLFQPSNNIQMGCTYVDILTSNYFDEVKNKKTRQYLMISAYNTGAGNVSVAYTGDTNLSQAFPKINSMSPQENYNHLRENLEYAEARNYLKKVTNRREMYSKWKQNKESTEGKGG